MAPAVKLLFSLLFLCIFAQEVHNISIFLHLGNCKRCDLSSIRVDQTNTGLKVRYDTVFEVEVKNLCGCNLRNVSLRSEGFASTIPVDPKLFRLQGGKYLINDGKAILGLRSVKFQYTWVRPFRMTPVGLQVACG